VKWSPGEMVAALWDCAWSAHL